MTTEQLATRLRTQLAALDAPPENFTVEAFKVWDSAATRALGSALVRIERRIWSWGHCRSETCGHVSHDPYEEGDVAYITCRRIGENASGDPCYQTPEGLIFTYRWAKDAGFHYAPTARIIVPGAIQAAAFEPVA